MTHLEKMKEKAQERGKEMEKERLFTKMRVYMKAGGKTETMMDMVDIQ